MDERFLGAERRHQRGGIIAAASLLAEYEADAAATFRATYHCSLYDTGRTLPWREAIHLLATAASDPGTFLGAAMVDARYPATIAENTLLGAVLALGGVHGPDAAKILPLGTAREPVKAPRLTEYEQATRALSEAFGLQLSDDTIRNHYDKTLRRR